MLYGSVLTFFILNKGTSVIAFFNTSNVSVINHTRDLKLVHSCLLFFNTSHGVQKLYQTNRYSILKYYCFNSERIHTTWLSKTKNWKYDSSTMNQTRMGHVQEKAFVYLKIPKLVIRSRTWSLGAHH